MGKTRAAYPPESGLVAKEIELICELVPRTSAIALLVNPNKSAADPLI